jgi:hypothetical protein
MLWQTALKPDLVREQNNVKVLKFRAFVAKEPGLEL